MRTRETPGNVLDHPYWTSWQRIVRLGQTSLGLEEYAQRCTQEGPTDTPRVFTLNEAALRRHYADFHADDLPYLTCESPATTIDCLLADTEPFITGPGIILAYPMQFDGEPDHLLIVVERENTGPTPLPRICGVATEWSEYANLNWLDGALTTIKMIVILNKVIAEANLLMATT